jgi:hypothetical protein
MYIVINKTKNTTTEYSGVWPNLDEVLNQGDKIIVISTYSNTIKVPYKEELNGNVEWAWESFSLNEVDL